MSIIPDKALLQHIAILGKTGSGKTYAAKGIAEDLLRRGERLCVVDPTGAWFGLRSSANGKRAGFPVVVFGGDHADVPLHAGSGQAIAEIVATTETSCVLDTGNLSVRDQTKLFTAFAEALYRLNRKPLHLIIDEAHNFAPQGRVADPQSADMLHATNKLLSQGRSRGLRIMLISQRPQKLHKDSLTQVETLIAMRLVAPQDRNAVEDWIGAWAEPKQGADLLASLPSLPTGEGWVWAPEVNLLKRVKFPQISTYDSSRAPDGDGSAIVLAKIDLPSIQARLDAVAKDVVDNDPKRLKARIAELELAKGKPDQEAIRKADEAGYVRGRADAGLALRVEVDGLAGISGRLGDLLSSLVVGGNVRGSSLSKPERPFLPKAVSAERIKLASPMAPVDGVTAPQQRILDAMAKLESLGVQHMTKGQAAAFAGASPKSSAFQNNVSRLRTVGLLDYPRSGEVVLTEAGRAAARYPDVPPTVVDLQAAWLRLLSGPQARILETVIAAFPHKVEKSELAERSGASALSSAFQNNVSALRSLGLLDYPEKGWVQATHILFPVA